MAHAAIILLLALSPGIIAQPQDKQSNTSDDGLKLSDFVVSIPVDTNHWDVAEAGRLWRKVHV